MTRPHHIAVTPVDGGWSIACDGGLEPMLFLSGGRAEAHARALARRLSEAGDTVEVVVRDRNSAVVGSTRYLSGEIA
jgi:hypothetical protein